MIVETKSGPVRGVERDGVKHWRGIPYARAPRFANPEPATPWTEVLDASRFGPAAIQSRDPRIAMMSGLTDKSITSEDCLSLNITAPSTPGPHPVVVWIHGGAFVMGTTATPLYNGTSFAATQGIVVVSIGYRLGLLGFLADESLAGNWALADQVAALRWVRDNIAGFGGDPARVTVMGESAGAMSIAILLGMPSARGLFHRAIIQSGGTNPNPPAVESPAAILAKLGGAGATVEKIVEVQETLVAEKGLAAFVPYVDRVNIPRIPLEVIREGSSANVPVLIGYNRDEWRLFELFLGYDRAIAPVKVPLAERFPDIEARLAEYGGDWTRLIGDVAFRWPAEQLALAHQAHAPVWMYRFDFASTAFGGNLGAAHAIELPLVWNVLDLPVSKILIGDVDSARPLAAKMHAIWGNFVRGVDPEWAQYRDDGATMIFDHDSRVSSTRTM